MIGRKRLSASDSIAAIVTLLLSAFDVDLDLTVGAIRSDQLARMYRLKLERLLLSSERVDELVELAFENGWQPV